MLAIFPLANALRPGVLRQLAIASLAMLASMAAPVATQAQILRVSLEEPVQGQSHSGVGNLRGWAVSSVGIEQVSIFIDDTFAFVAPYGGQRNDVGEAFPDVPDSANSGFSLAYNYSDLSAGQHTIRAEALTTGGQTISTQATFNVLRFESSFIADPDLVDVSGAQCVINDQNISLIDAVVEGTPTDITLQWRTATQGFELFDVR